MLVNGTRKITVKKKDLIVQVKTNKKTHLKEYKDAVKSYKALAIGELNKRTEEIEANRLKEIDILKKRQAREMAQLKKDLKKTQARQNEEIQKEIQKVQEGQMFTKQVSTETPKDNSEKYDEIVNLFEWDVLEEVELNQKEFSEYINDKTPWAEESKLSNSSIILGGTSNTATGYYNAQMGIN